MDKNEEVINNVQDIFLKMNKGEVSVEDISNYCDNTQTNFN